MKAFLLAAGNGTRLRPLTSAIPKCMVPIRGTPLLGIWLDWCYSNGIDEILINVHAHAETVTAYLAGNFDIRVTVSREQKLLGSAGTLLANRDFIDGEEEFAILYADVLTNCCFEEMRAFHRAHRSLATLGLYRVSNPSMCGIASIEGNGRITAFEEKPAYPNGNLAFSGLMIATPAALESISDRVPCDIGSDLLPRLVDRMYGYVIDDYLIDIGSHEKYALAQREWPGRNQMVSARQC
jgi:mannose-1-phosphate guanylyltransferase